MWNLNLFENIALYSNLSVSNLIKARLPQQRVILFSSFQALVRVVPDDQCRGELPHSIICAKSIDGATCNGDSGSYVGGYDSSRGRYVQSGIVSYGVDGCKEEMGMTETALYNDWIANVVQNE